MTGFDVYIRKVVEKGKVIFPEKFTIEDTDNMGDGRQKTNVQQLKASQGSFHFSAQYNNDPLDEEAVEFKMKYYQEVENIPQHGLDRMFVDPAFTNKQQYDDSGIVITRESEGIVYVIEALGIKRQPTELINELFRLWEAYPNIIMTKVESTIGQRVLITLLKQEMLKRNKFYPIDEFLPYTNEKKAARIRQLIPRYEAGGFRFKEGLKKLKDQMVEFPRSRHDDVLDALSQGVADWQTAMEAHPEKPPNQEGTFGWWKKHARGPVRVGSKLFEDMRFAYRNPMKLARGRHG